jgi:hypothetical protein
VILAYAALLLIVLALLLGRDLSAIGRLSYRGGWKLAGIVVGLFVSQAVTVLYVPGQRLFQAALLILSQMALVLLFILNRHLPGAKLFALGIILNTSVMAANGGWMPVTPETHHFVHPHQPVPVGGRPASSKNVVLPRTDTKLWPLSDIIRVTLPWRRYAMSMGDLLLILGTALFIFGSTSRRDKALT